MKSYRVEFITREQAGEFFNYSYTGQWFDELVDAGSEAEAIELVKDYLRDNGDENAADHIYRAKER